MTNNFRVLLSNGQVSDTWEDTKEILAVEVKINETLILYVGVKERKGDLSFLRAFCNCEEFVHDMRLPKILELRLIQKYRREIDVLLAKIDALTPLLVSGLYRSDEGNPHFSDIMDMDTGRSCLAHKTVIAKARYLFLPKGYKAPCAKDIIEVLY